MGFRAILRLPKLKGSKSGLALIEFAFSLPIFIGLGFYGVEIANLAITLMKMSQIALRAFSVHFGSYPHDLK